MRWLPSLLRWAGREATGILSKEILKWALLGLLAVVGAWLLNTISSVLQVSGDSWSAVFQKMWEEAVNAVRHPHQAFLNDPAYYFVLLVLASGNLTLIVLLRRSNRKVRVETKERVLAKQAGIGGRWPHARLNNPDGAPTHPLPTPDQG
jgi:hypothetical protein